MGFLLTDNDKLTCKGRCHRHGNIAYLCYRSNHILRYVSRLGVDQGQWNRWCAVFSPYFHEACFVDCGC